MPDRCENDQIVRFTPLCDMGQCRKNIVDPFDIWIWMFECRYVDVHRQRLPDDLSQQTEEHRPAVLLVHSDYTPRSGPARVRDILPDEADGLLTGRVAFYNVWKSLKDVVEELPLACCDARSSIDEDMLLMNLKYSDRTGEIPHGRSPEPASHGG